jgi:vancomycin resistance protein YoaR
MVVAGCLAVALLIGATVYAGSAGTLAEGETIAGVDVGGLSTKEATRLLERRAAALRRVPVVVHAGTSTFRFRQGEIRAKVDWPGAVRQAKSRADGFGPIRGFRRMYLRAFGSEVTPSVTVEGRALDLALAQIAKQVGHPHRDAAITLRGLHAVVVPGHAGRSIDRAQARAAILAAFANLDRRTIKLPLVSDPPSVTALALAPVAVKVRTALASPVYLQFGPTRYRLARWQVAGMLRLPSNGSRRIEIGGKKADAFMKHLQKAINRPPKSATFAVHGSKVRVVPDQPGRTLQVPVTVHNLLSAALSKTRRTAVVVASLQPAQRTAEDARAMGVKETVSSYTTYFGGVPNRIHNVELVSHLIDDTLIGPGSTFSFNGTTGDRNAQKGFLEAPVIINGELTTGLGGGVCQVSTTVFNAAYEAGLNITARTNHALYISHYPQGRDATVNYPDVDLKFINDTGHWLLLRTYVSSSALTVNLYGTNPHRRVESETAPLVVDGPPPLEKVKDPTLTKGETVVEAAGSSPLSTSVHRTVYSAKDKLLYDTTWSSHYVGETRIVRVGTKPKPKPVVPVGTTGPTGPSGTSGSSDATGATGPTGPEASSAEASPGAVSPIP